MIKKTAGFTLIEILVIVIIITILSSLILPQFKGFSTVKESQQFFFDLNALTQLAWQQAISTRKIHKIFFDFKARQAWIERETTPSSTSVSSQAPSFVKVLHGYLKTVIKWPATIEIRQFIIEGFDEMSKTSAGIKNAYFYLMPDGLTQEVIINLLYKRSKKSLENRFGLILNPFNAQFKVYNAFQK